jgi:hypothetical protein
MSPAFLFVRRVRLEPFGKVPDDEEPEQTGAEEMPGAHGALKGPGRVRQVR